MFYSFIGEVIKVLDYWYIFSSFLNYILVYKILAKIIAVYFKFLHVWIVLPFPCFY